MTMTWQHGQLRSTAARPASGETTRHSTTWHGVGGGVAWAGGGHRGAEEKEESGVGWVRVCGLSI